MECNLRNAAYEEQPIGCPRTFSPFAYLGSKCRQSVSNDERVVYENSDLRDKAYETRSL